MGVDINHRICDSPMEDLKLKTPAEKIYVPWMTCHQCKRNDKGEVVHCKKCNKKKYCHSCIHSWYPLLGFEYIAEACPGCRGICNCRDCLRKNPEVVVERFSGADRVTFLKN